MLSLETKFLALTAAFRFIVFGLLVVGLIVRLSRHIYHPDEIVRPVARAIVITALVASQGWWFPLVETGLRDVAAYIQPTYNDNPTEAADALRESATPNPDGNSWSWRNISRSVFYAITDAVSWLFILISTLITAPMLFLQYILRWVLYFLTPIALGCFMIPALSGMATRFFQQLVAILSWPIGFALTNVVTISIWQDFRAAVGITDTTKAIANYMTFLPQCGMTLAGLALLIGTISTPIVCHMFFTSGSAITGQSSTPIAIARGASEAVGRTAGLTHGLGLGLAIGGAGSHVPSSPPPPPPANYNHHPGL